MTDEQTPILTDASVLARTLIQTFWNKNETLSITLREGDIVYYDDFIEGKAKAKIVRLSLKGGKTYDETSVHLTFDLDFKGEELLAEDAGFILLPSRMTSGRVEHVVHFADPLPRNLKTWMKEIARRKGFGIHTDKRGQLYWLLNGATLKCTARAKVYVLGFPDIAPVGEMDGEFVIPPAGHKSDAELAEVIDGKSHQK